jgi:uncharacterized protein YciI
MYWLLFYDYVDDIVERRAPLRDAHLAAIRDSHDRGALVAAGALSDPVDGAVFVFRADDAAVVEEFARNDPYVKEELVTGWRVRPWNVVAGDLTRKE